MLLLFHLKNTILLFVLILKYTKSFMQVLNRKKSLKQLRNLFCITVLICQKFDYILNYGTKADYITFYVPQRINILRQTWNAIRNEFYAWSKPSERTFCTGVVFLSFFSHLRNCFHVVSGFGRNFL